MLITKIFFPSQAIVNMTPKPKVLTTNAEGTTILQKVHQENIIIGLFIQLNLNQLLVFGSFGPPMTRATYLAFV